MSEFVRVPKEPTLAMVCAGERKADVSDADIVNIYREMLDAAPTAPPASPGPEPLTKEDRALLAWMLDHWMLGTRHKALLTNLAAIADHYRNQCAQGKEE